LIHPDTPSPEALAYFAEEVRVYAGDPANERRLLRTALVGLTALSFLQGLSLLRLAAADQRADGQDPSAVTAGAQALAAGDRMQLEPRPEATVTTLPPTTTTTVVERAASGAVTVHGPNRTGPHTAADAERVTVYPNHLEYLRANTNPTLEAFLGLVVNKDHAEAFRDEGAPKDAAGNFIKINPRAFILHWTGFKTPPDGIEDFIQRIKRENKGHCCSVQFYVDRAGTIFQLMPAPDDMAWQARGANEWSAGVEIEAHGPEDYTPAQLTAATYVTLQFLRTFNLPISRETILGHYEVTRGKTDPTPVIVDLVAEKVGTLNHLLHLQGG
jgi:hypothetical protein